MANLTLRQTKGSALTIVETDGNFEYFTGSYTNTGIITAAGFSGSFTGSITSTYITLPIISSSLNFINDTAAAIGGVPLGGLYRNGSFIQIRLI
jgi:hypothetical protein